MNIMHKTLWSISKDLVVNDTFLSTIQPCEQVESVALVPLYYSQVNIRGSRIIAGHFFQSHKDKRTTKSNMSNKIKTMYNLISTHSELSSILVHTLSRSEHDIDCLKHNRQKVWSVNVLHVSLSFRCASLINVKHDAWDTAFSFHLPAFSVPWNLISNVKIFFNLSCFTMNLIKW